jgi:hypothetical protein
LKSLPVLFLSSLLLTGCATLSKNECLTANWASIGYEDGSQGQTRDRIGSHRRACADYGIDPDFEEYLQGYNQGLEIFCTPQNGFLKGKSGYTDTGICTGNLGPGFLQGYENGREIYIASGEVSRLRRELQTVENRIGLLENEVYRKEKLLFSESLSKNERRHIYYEISDIKIERRDLLLQREEILDDKYDAEEDLEYLEGRYPKY